MCELDPDAVARVRRDDGMKRAVDHADRVSHAWSVLTYSFVQKYIQSKERTFEFIAEDIVTLAEKWGVPKPPDNRAWGAIIQRAARAGLIVKAGYREDRYCSPKTLWRRA